MWQLTPRLAPRLAPLFTLLLAVTAMAGPLNPPIGPVTNTGKTTQEIFDKVAAVDPRTAISASSTPGNATSVFRITTSGSYYLTSNFSGVAGKNGISIECDDVTLDLNGFTVQGVAGSLAGIITPTGIARANISVRNGTVKGWGQQGILLTGSTTKVGSLVESVIASDNTGDGLALNGRAIVRACTAHHNGGDGFHMTSGNSDAFNCTALFNTGDGFDSAGGLITSCVSSNNSANGFRVTNVHITGCLADTNTVDGYAIFTQCRVDGNTATSNATGYHTTSSGALIINNAASGNTTEYSLVTSSNTCGPIVTIANIATNTNPTANFDY